MPLYQLLTDRTLAQSSAITPTTLIHIVYTGDPSQNIAGSSYKAELQQLSSIFSGSTFTGGTVSGATNFTNGLTANTISATTYQNLPQFSGGSGNCITDLFVSNIHSCSPLYINPLNEGDVYFGSVTSGVTFNISNSRIGIGTLSPQYTLDLRSSSSNLILNTSSTGNTLELSGNTRLPRFGVIISPYLTKPVGIGSMGIRAWNDSTYPGYGKVGDMHIYASNSVNGLNIINQGTGTTTDDYIRFYAGKDALGDDPDIHIQGSGATRGYVGVGTKTPTEILDVEGNARFRTVGAATGVNALYITSNGTLTTVSSDVRLKENIEPLTNSLENVLQLTGVTYSWIGQEERRIGFIAQEVEKVIPELVFTNNNTEDKIKGIHLDNITAILVEAIKEQQKIIEELKVRISNLEL